MAQPTPCPSCYSVNKPGAPRCRVCGRKLRESVRAARASRPVLLERVMSGEVFTAVIGGVARRPSSRDLAEDRETLAREASKLEEYRRALREYEAMLRTKAVTEGQPFAIYEPAKRRRRRKERTDEEAEEALGPAIDAMRKQRFEEAVALLRGSIERDDEDPRAWILLGEASLRIGGRFDAASAFHRALDLDPRDERGWVGLAKALREVGELPAALSSLDKALAINPNLPEAWAERGLVLEALENLSEALRSFAKAIELRPDYETARTKRMEVEERLLEHAREQGLVSSAANATEAPPAAGTETDLEFESEPSPHAPNPDAKIDEILGLDDPAADAAPSPAAPEEPEEVVEATRTVAPRPAEPLPRGRRMRTYVDGLDDALDGGIPWGHVVLIQGTPGTLKSSLAFSILRNNAAWDGRHGMYLSLEERSDSLLRQAASLGLDVRVDRGSLVLLDPRSAQELLTERRDWVPGLQRAIEAIRQERGLDLLVIDSLDALEVLAKFQDRRREVYRLFEWLRDLGITTFVITERAEWIFGGHVVQGRWDEDFLADGVIQLRLHMVSELDVQRRIRVMKMRGVRHETGYFAFVFDDGRFRMTRAMSA